MEEHACERTWEGFRAYDLRHGCVRSFASLSLNHSVFDCFYSQLLFVFLPFAHQLFGFYSFLSLTNKLYSLKLDEYFVLLTDVN